MSSWQKISRGWVLQNSDQQPRLIDRSSVINKSMLLIGINRMHKRGGRHIVHQLQVHGLHCEKYKHAYITFYCLNHKMNSKDDHQFEADQSGLRTVTTRPVGWIMPRYIFIAVSLLRPTYVPVELPTTIVGFHHLDREMWFLDALNALNF